MSLILDALNQLLVSTGTPATVFLLDVDADEDGDDLCQIVLCTSTGLPLSSYH